ncbi:unnamed protein product, partial [Brenthis ino]
MLSDNKTVSILSITDSTRQIVLTFDIDNLNLSLIVLSVSFSAGLVARSSPSWNKREVWRVKYTLARIRKAARELLTLEEKDPKRLFEGNALLRRLVRIGVLDEKQMKLDYVLGLKIEDFLERRLQTQVFKAGLAKSIHHARILIRQRHIRVRKQVVNIPSFIVRLDSGKHIDFSLKSPFGGGRPGRVKRKNLRKGQGGGATNDEEED